MTIYKIVGDKDRLDKIDPTSFGKEGVLERSDLQRMLRDQPDVLEEGLFIITEEFSNWQGSGRSIDLLGLDAAGRLVVIELKRGETGEHMDLQAIRYAAMVSTITLQQAIDAHQSYLNKLGFEEDAEERITEHLENNEDARFASERPRIILASEGFSPELTTCALWLNDCGLDVTCIRMQPHRSGKELLVEASQIIPLPEAQNYLVRVRDREEDAKEKQSSGQFIKHGEVFAGKIEMAPESIQPSLKKLYDWATGLERNSLANLWTHRHNERFSLSVALNTGHSPSLIAVHIHRSAMRFRPRYWKKYCPDSVYRVDSLVDQRISRLNSSFSVRLEDVDDDLLSALTEAYREANSRLVGDNDRES
jgi:hypothetical protein